MKTAYALAMILGMQPVYADAGIFGPSKPTKEEIRARIVNNSQGNPEDVYRSAIEAAKQNNYDAAEDLFVKVIDFGPANNKYFMSTVDWISKKGKDKLFRHMAEYQPIILDGERAAFEVEVKKLKGMTKDNPQYSQLALKLKTRINKIKRMESDLEYRLNTRK